jgi:hypothetical protein
VTAPTPLRHQRRASGTLLCAANLAFRDGLDERAAWRRLQQRQRRAPAASIGAMVVLGAAAGILVWLAAYAFGGPWFDRDSDVNLAERELPQRSRPPAPATSTPLVLPPAELEPRLPQVRPKAAAPRKLTAAPEPSPAPSASAPADQGSAVECLEFARRGQPARAENCFLQQSTGTGLVAQMALYELARLRKDALGDAAGAHRALADYRERFPDGSLRTEVEVSMVELLVRLGRFEQALTESEHLLQTSYGQERSVQLRLLRGNLYRTNLNDCARAEVEYRHVRREPGARSDQAEYYRAVCLEQLGRRDEAVQAYRAYLDRPNAARSQQAEQRLQRLSSAGEVAP